MAPALATRCPSCSTVFRVVRDQLRVSDGWVRCGRCAEVFRATESLVDLETGAPLRWDPAGPPASAERLAASAHGAASPPPAAASEPGVPGAGAAPWATPPSSPPGPAETGAGAAAPSAAPPDFDGQPFDTPAPDPREAGAGDEVPIAILPWDAVADERDPALGPAAAGALPAGREPTRAAVTATTASAAADDVPFDDDRGLATSGAAATPPAPSFVRRADRAERWRRPAVRVALGGAALALALLAVGQVVHAYRDLAAARFPSLRPALAAGCALIGCRIEPARAIGALTVEGTALVRDGADGLHRLSLSLRNRAGIDLALPAVELTLTDTQGRLVVRKVLSADELGATASTIAAGRELPLQATLSIALPGDAPVAGYTVELFYP